MFSLEHDKALTGAETLELLLASFFATQPLDAEVLEKLREEADLDLRAEQARMLPEVIEAREKAAELGLTPRARFKAFSVVGVDPITMLTGPIPATEKVLDKAGLAIDDIDLFEVNEAFASVIAAWLQDTGADWEKTNVNGGAMALGHPLGASGAKLMTTLLHEMERRGARYGLQTMCEGGGMANGTILELIES